METRRVALALTVSAMMGLAGPRVADGQVRCGVARWPVKTLTDRDSQRVDMLAVDATISMLGQLPTPSGYPNDQRIAPHELHVYRVHAIVQQILTESDGDWHVVLRDPDNAGATMIAEIPSPECSGNETQRALYMAARMALRTIPRYGMVIVEGVGFFDIAHNQRGRAPNAFELHPVQLLRADTSPAR